jgi:cell shape-determining protein MreC
MRDGVVQVDAKKAMVLVGVAFVLFYLITQPVQSANVVHDVLSWLRDAADAIVTFIKQLFA